LSAKIRLVRAGSRGKPFYRIVVMDESAARNASPIEFLGQYDPAKEPAVFNIDTEKAASWLKKGALPTETVRKYLGKAGLLPPVDYSKKKKKAPKNQEAAAEAPAAPAA